MAKRNWWQLPSIRQDEDEHRHRRVSWLELFFDLVFVAAISQLSQNLASDVSIMGFAKFVMLFIPVWWVWIGSTFYNERFETEGLEARFFTFLLILPTAGLAIFAHNGLGYSYTGFALSYFAARFLINVLWVRAGIHAASFRPVSKRYAIGFSLSNLLVVTSIYVPQPYNLVLFGAALFSDLTTPLFTIKYLGHLPRFSTSRLPERFGLLILIVLGEAVVAVVNGLSRQYRINQHEAVIGLLGITLGFCFWWIYFDYINRRPAKANPWSSFFWSYLHMPLVMGIIGASAGILNLINDPFAVPNANIRVLTAISTAIFILVVAMIELILKREKNEPSHPLWSPLSKIIAATPPILACFITISSVQLLLLLIASMSICMCYGAYVWFSQDFLE